MPNKKLKSMFLPTRVDARTTIASLYDLARKNAANDDRPPIGAVVGLLFADDSVEFHALGVCKRNSDRAARIANQLADSLLWEK